MGLKRRVSSLIVAGLMGGFCVVAPAEAGIFWGASASGTATEYQVTCSTCPNPIIDLSAQDDGGSGSTSASVVYGTSAFVTYLGAAHLDGPHSLPSLSASAMANIWIDPDFTTHFYSGFAEARGTQLYAYMGATSADYTLEYTIDGSLDGGDLTQIAGGFTVFGAGYDPAQELQPILGTSFDTINGTGGPVPVLLTGSVTFTLNPGDMFYVQATLSAYADSRSNAQLNIADAEHTLGMTITQGDGALLAPVGVADVPEPGAVLLIFGGLLGLRLFRRGFY